MRPNKAVATQVGNLGGEKVQMSFDSNSLAHIMGILTDLYSDSELAVIREYSTNGLDAQIRAGYDGPIEVTTPNPLSPFFRVKDNGVGMDADDIRNIYSQYGASTKRDSDEFTGMLGLGCKAALSYTNQFTINAVKNGVRTQVIVSRTEDGSGVMEIISETETDDSNGVEISVPVKRNNGFTHKADTFFSFWDEGTVLLNGAPPKKVEGKRISDTVWAVPDLNSDYVVMGNVPYPVDDENQIFSRSWRNRMGIVVRVGIGEVSFTPSREALHYTRKTVETLNEVRENLNDNLTAAINSDINEAVSKIDAVERYMEWDKTLGSYMMPAVKYQGEELPRFTRIPNSLVFNTGLSRGAVSEPVDHSIQSLSSYVVIYNYSNLDLKSHNREKIRGWLESKYRMAKTILITETLPPEYGTWISDKDCYDWDEVKKFRVKRATVEKQEAAYDVFTPTGYKTMTLSEIPSTGTLGLISASELRSFESGYLRKVKNAFPDLHVIRTPKSRWDKLLRERSNASSLQDIVKKGFEEAKAALTELDIARMTLRYDSKHVLESLDETAIEDPEVVDMIKVSKANRDTDGIIKYLAFRNLYSAFSSSAYAMESCKYNLFDKYPLLESLSRNDYEKSAEHATIYVNTIYGMGK